MKLSENTIELLKNFSTLNQSLQFKSGSVLKTITPSFSVLAIATVKETFPIDFAIYDLNKLLAKLSLYRDEYKLEFKEDRLVLKSNDGRRSDYIKYCSPKVIKIPEKDLQEVDSPYKFTLSQEDLLWQRKSAGISGTQHIVFRGDGKKIYLQATDLKDDSSDLSSTAVAETDGKFVCVTKVEYLKMMDGSYKVELNGKYIKFEHTEKDLIYFVAVESALSKFN